MLDGSRVTHIPYFSADTKGSSPVKCHELGTSSDDGRGK
jgi:hypothetical protein